MFWRKKGKDATSEVKIFFASDLHGSNVCFKKFVNGAKFYNADVLVLGGDLTGKAVIPIAEQSDGSFLAFQHGESLVLNGKPNSMTSSNDRAISGFIHRSCPSPSTSA